MFRVLLNTVWLQRSMKNRAEQTAARQLALLNERIGQAVHEVPFYGELYSSMNLGPVPLASLDDLTKLPVVTKSAVKANFPDAMVPRWMNWDQLYLNATSGTTDRVVVFHDETKRNWDRAADLLLHVIEDRLWPGRRSLAIPPDACYEYCGADGRILSFSVWETFRDFILAPANRRRAQYRRFRSTFMREYVRGEKRLSSLGPEGTGTAPAVQDDLCRDIHAWGPRLLSGLPMTLHILANRVRRQHGVARNLQVIRPFGGKLSPRMIATVEAAFGASVRENYGTAELGTISFDCRHSREQHLLGELFFIEFLRAGQPVAPGELGEMLITDLRNAASPLIRYEVGDVGRYRTDPCECGFAGTRFQVEGRLEETVVLPDGRVFGGASMLDAILAHPAVDYAKITQEQGTQFVVEVVPAPGAEPPREADLADRLRLLLQCDTRVRLRVVKSITPERSGKFKLVLSSSFRQFHEPSTIAAAIQ